MKQDGHTSAADQAVVPSVVTVEGEGAQQRGSMIMESGQSTPFDVRFNAATTEGAGLLAIGVHYHGSTGLLRGTAPGFHDLTVNTL